MGLKVAVRRFGLVGVHQEIDRKSAHGADVSPPSSRLVRCQLSKAALVVVSRSSSVLRRSTVLDQYGGPRGGARAGTSVVSPIFFRYRATLRSSITSAKSFIRPLQLGHSRTSSPNVRRIKGAHGQ